MGHRNARLTQFGGLLLVQRSIELGWPPPRPPKPWAVSRATAYQLAGPLARPGPAGMADRSSRPHRCLHALPASQVRGCWPPADATARASTGWPGGCTCFAPRSMGLRCHHMSRLGHTDRTSGVPDSAGAGRRVTGGRVGADCQLAAPSGQGSAQRAGVVELGAAVLDVAEVGLLGDGAGLGARMPELEPEGAGPTATASLARGSPCRCPRGSRPGVADALEVSVALQSVSTHWRSESGHSRAVSRSGALLHPAPAPGPSRRSRSNS